MKGKKSNVIISNILSHFNFGPYIETPPTQRGEVGYRIDTPGTYAFQYRPKVMRSLSLVR